MALALAAAAPQYRLANPAQVLVMKDGALLVVERGTRNHVLRVNPETGSTSVYATGIPAPWGLAYARNGSVLVSGTSGLYRLRPRTKLASLSVSPFVPLPDGRIAYANETSVGVLAGGKARPWRVSVSAPHGFGLLPDGALALSDTGNNRILRIDPATGTTMLLTDRVSTALGIAAEPSGSLLTVEYGSGRLLRVDPAGAISVVATGLHKPYSLARARSGIVYVTESGEDSRPTGTLRRVLPDGRTSVVPLRPPPARTTAATRPRLSQPFDVLPVAGGRLLVTDLPAGLVYSIDPARRAARVVAHVFQARELARLRDGRILVTSPEKVLTLDPRTGKTSIYATAKNYLLGIAVGPDGSLYASENVPGTEETTLVRLRDGTRQVLLTATRGIHEFLVAPDGFLLPESYAGRVLHLDATSGKVEVLATGLGNPSSALPASAGGWFISEFTGNRVSHLWPDGHLTTLASVVQPGRLAFDAHHRIVGVTLTGTVFRIERGRARTIYP